MLSACRKRMLNACRLLLCLFSRAGAGSAPHDLRQVAARWASAHGYFQLSQDAVMKALKVAHKMRCCCGCCAAVDATRECEFSWVCLFAKREQAVDFGVGSGSAMGAATSTACWFDYETDLEEALVSCRCDLMLIHMYLARFARTPYGTVGRRTYDVLPWLRY